MNLFDQLVKEALSNRKELSALRSVVEKELLHHDILRELNNAGMLAQLTFMGGTCLRACYGSNRLSEDLDFTGGKDFNRTNLSAMAGVLVANLKRKYGLEITVSEPTREVGNVDTWKLKVQTRPGRKDFPAQRINIDICSIPSYDVCSMMLRNLYEVELGTSGLIVQAESREEIFTDKLIAFALRPNRIKHRDLWDIAWLHQQAVKPAWELLSKKLNDHHCSPRQFLKLFQERAEELKIEPALRLDFKQEMQRFLPTELIKQTVNQAAFWSFLVQLMQDLYTESKQVLSEKKPINRFPM
jgi:predicted nucleotidyltransferase component of viral defense system